MTIYKSGTTAFQGQTAGVTAKSTAPAPATPGGSSYWYSTAAATVADYQRWDLASADTWQFRRLVYVDAATTTDIDLLAFRTGADAGNNMIIRIQGTDKLRVVANGGGFVFTSTVSFPHDGWYRLEGYGSATANTARVALFPVASSTAVTGLDSGDLTVAQGSLAPTGVRFGRLSNTTGYSGIVAWDEDEVRTGVDASLSFIGPYSAALSCTTAATTTGLSATATITPVGYTAAAKLYDFAWGDGVTTAAQSSATASHTYSAAGTYTITGGVDYA